MGFKEKYAALEEKFRAQVEEDRVRHGVDSIYVSNPRPVGRVDFVLIAMEPSIGRRPNYLDSCTPPQGFSWQIPDFLLHYCIRNYLCKRGQTYHITDLSKGAMKTQDARRGYKERYKRWFPLLTEELKLVNKEEGETRLIAIGKVVGEFLMDKGLCPRTERVLHPSPNNNGHLNKAIGALVDEYHEFCGHLNIEHFESTIGEVLRETHRDLELTEEQVEKVVQWRLKEHRHIPKLMGAESWKVLMFYYRNKFERLKEDPDIVLNVDSVH